MPFREQKQYNQKQAKNQTTQKLQKTPESTEKIAKGHYHYYEPIHNQHEK